VTRGVKDTLSNDEAIKYLRQAASANLARNKASRAKEDTFPFEVEMSTCREMYLSLGGNLGFFSEFLAEAYYTAPFEEGGSGATPE
jgi:hypothetical protein